MLWLPAPAVTQPKQTKTGNTGHSHSPLSFSLGNNYLSFVTGTTSFRGRHSTHPSAAGNASCSREATPSTRTSLAYHSAVIRDIKSAKKTIHHNKLQHLPSTFFICLHLPRLLAQQLTPTVSQVLQKLERMLAKRATTPLDLHIKEFAMELATPLTSIVNASLQRPNGRPRISPPSGKLRVPPARASGSAPSPGWQTLSNRQQAVRV